MNIATLLRRAARDHADRVALRLGDEELTYRRFADDAARFAGFLLGEGAAPGQRVGFFLPNGPEYLVGLLGVWQAGGVGVPLNHLFGDAALRHAIADSGATHLVVPPGDVPRLTALLEGLPVAGHLLTTGPGGGFPAAVAGHEAVGPVVPRLDGDDALIMYTSGSTGVPKGVRQTHRNVVAQVEAVIDLYGIGPDDHALNCAPLFHVGGLQLVSLPVLLRGGEITMMARWDPVAWLELAARLRPTYGIAVATMAVDIGNRTAGSPVVLDSFRVFMYGGSRTPSAVVRRLEEGIGVPPIEIYGQTEQNGLAVSRGSGEPRRAGAMGHPLEQIVQVRVVPPGGDDVPPGSDEVGELWVRGDAVTPGYWNGGDPGAATGAEKWVDGWFRTGDLVRRDADGWLSYVDRIDDMIVSGGENVFPQMVEEHLADCPDLAEVAVVGTPHERWIEQVTAVVVPTRPGVTVDDVLGWCATNANLRGMLTPRRVEIVEALPRTGSGKLDRPALRRSLG
ncbi:AMP-dependent synthetase [Actinomycetospora sp. NBRC 106375]|uniref:class I adenylate-forming enzyme family protein n=1 Tax=Actinomycetospora sp. NBRC 106375 TaxID=3032207 RepID=UPI0024A551A9|nr:class I adenylate-forming enzyme family protein [Actinomycetospora sp. NBRC 106375]GLZ48125.1 AMP-dependent synthetase [Actinomycetospora sp. NBRC 106375]